jgi:hypothetical protein
MLWQCNTTSQHKPNKNEKRKEKGRLCHWNGEKEKKTFTSAASKFSSEANCH